MTKKRNIKIKRNKPKNNTYRKRKYYYKSGGGFLDGVANVLGLNATTTEGNEASQWRISSPPKTNENVQAIDLNNATSFTKEPSSEVVSQTEESRDIETVNPPAVQMNTEVQNVTPVEPLQPVINTEMQNVTPVEPLQSVINTEMQNVTPVEPQQPVANVEMQNVTPVEPQQQVQQIQQVQPVANVEMQNVTPVEQNQVPVSEPDDDEFVSPNTNIESAVNSPTDQEYSSAKNIKNMPYTENQLIKDVMAAQNKQPKYEITDEARKKTMQQIEEFRMKQIKEAEKRKLEILEQQRKMDEIVNKQLEENRRLSEKMDIDKIIMNLDRNAIQDKLPIGDIRMGGMGKRNTRKVLKKKKNNGGTKKIKKAFKNKKSSRTIKIHHGKHKSSCPLFGFKFGFGGSNPKQIKRISRKKMNENNRIIHHKIMSLCDCFA
jgi:hypothetical protein